MVRLGGLPIWCNLPRLCISIPVWYDWGHSFAGERILIYIISIPVWYDWGPGPGTGLSASHTHFNSSMVRLGELKIRLRIIPFVLFQFQYGTIGGKLAKKEYFMFPNFNSSMVRLGVEAVGVYPLSLVIFQFQYGTIGGLSIFSSSRSRSSISIPVWYDWGPSS